MGKESVLYKEKKKKENEGKWGMANQVYFHLSGNLIFLPSCSVHPRVLFS